MDAARKETLARLAVGRADSPHGLLLKVQALAELWREFEWPLEGAALERLRRELHVVANAKTSTHREAQAVAMALGVLNEIEHAIAVQYPSPTPDEPAGPRYWPHCCTSSHHQQGRFQGLDDADTQADRDDWRSQVEGPPPWRHPPVDELAAA
jgi:hypothetical protein